MVLKLKWNKELPDPMCIGLYVSITPFLVSMLSPYRQLRTRRAFSLFINVPLGTRKGAIAVQSLWQQCLSSSQQINFEW